MMGEKELMISTSFPIEYVERDEKALETSFQAPEIMVTTSTEVKEGGSKLSKAAIMATKVLINNDFQPGKDWAKTFELYYTKATEERRRRRKAPGKKWIRPDLYRYFTSGGIISPNQIATIEDQLPELEEWVIPTNHKLDNWTAKALPELTNTTFILLEATNLRKLLTDFFLG
ncbi:hypothetical protein CR513_43486, partial [Mucuna pruriens]